MENQHPEPQNQKEIWEEWMFDTATLTPSHPLRPLWGSIPVLTKHVVSGLKCAESKWASPIISLIGIVI
jgi:hypothetical protein